MAEWLFLKVWISFFRHEEADDADEGEPKGPSASQAWRAGRYEDVY